MTRFRDLRANGPEPGQAKVICRGCGRTMAHADRPGLGDCSRCLASVTQQPVPGTRALRRALFGHRRSRAGRLSPADHRRAAALGVDVPPTLVTKR